MSKAVKAHGTCPSCGHDGCFTEYADESTYCFSCLKATAGSGEEQQSMFLIPPSVLDGEVSFPSTISQEFPIKERRWLLVYGIDNHIRQKYSIYYVKNANSGATANKTLKLIKNGIMLPVFKQDKLSFYQVRFLDSDLKYLTVGKPHLAQFGPQSDTLVLVEDILSAIRVAESGANLRAGALLGLGTKKEELLLECKQYKNVILWLDDDDAGNKASDQLQRRLKLYTKVFKVKSSLEAKECYNAEIRERLQGTSLIEL